MDSHVRIYLPTSESCTLLDFFFFYIVLICHDFSPLLRMPKMNDMLMVWFSHTETQNHQEERHQLPPYANVSEGCGAEEEEYLNAGSVREVVLYWDWGSFSGDSTACDMRHNERSEVSQRPKFSCIR